MKKARLKEQKTKKEVITEEKFSTGTVVVTAIILLLCVVGTYFLTVKLVANRGKENTNSNTTIDVRKDNTIKYSEVKEIKDKSYYLFFDKADDELNNTYDTYINSLKLSNYPTEFYYIDLSDEDNKDLLAKEEKLEKIDDIKVSDTTLLLIDDGDIKSKYVGASEVSNYLLSFFMTNSNITINASNVNSDENKENKSNVEEKETKKDDEK